MHTTARSDPSRSRCKPDEERDGRGEVLSFDHVRYIDVVERDERVIKLVGPHYEKDSRVHIHHADAYEQAKKWPAGTRCDVGWSDIWGDYSTDDLSSMARLNCSYGRRCTWHKCWQQEYLQYRKNQEQRHQSMWC